MKAVLLEALIALFAWCVKSVHEIAGAAMLCITVMLCAMTFVLLSIKKLFSVATEHSDSAKLV